MEIFRATMCVHPCGSDEGLRVYQWQLLTTLLQAPPGFELRKHLIALGSNFKRPAPVFLPLGPLGFTSQNCLDQGLSKRALFEGKRLLIIRAAALLARALLSLLRRCLCEQLTGELKYVGNCL